MALAIVQRRLHRHFRSFHFTPPRPGAAGGDGKGSMQRGLLEVGLASAAAFIQLRRCGMGKASKQQPCDEQPKRTSNRFHLHALLRNAPAPPDIGQGRFE
jgi:hypothetical protein